MFAFFQHIWIIQCQVDAMTVLKQFLKVFHLLLRLGCEDDTWTFVIVFKRSWWWLVFGIRLLEPDRLAHLDVVSDELDWDWIFVEYLLLLLLNVFQTRNVLEDVLVCIDDLDHRLLFSFDCMIIVLHKLGCGCLFASWCKWYIFDRRLYFCINVIIRDTFLCLYKFLYLLNVALCF